MSDFGKKTQNAGFVRDIRVFVSSPGDMSEERGLIKRICEEITGDLGGLHGFRINPLLWETHTHSAKGERSQQVITDQIGSYDIFLGIMGFYFGSSTGTHGSGTEEEYRDALSRTDKFKAPKIQFYFSNAEINPNKIDIEQFQKVKAFKSEAVGRAGVLYKEFKDLTQLSILVRKALIAETYAFLESNLEFSPQESEKTGGIYSELEPYDQMKNFTSLLENNHNAAIVFLSQVTAQEFNKITNDMTTVTKLMADAGAATARFTKEFEVVQRTDKDPKFLIKKLGVLFQSIEKTNAWLLERTSPIEASFHKAMSSLQRAGILTYKTSKDPDADLAELEQLLENLSSSMVLVQDAMANLAISIPEVEDLGQRWAGNRSIMIALLADFTTYLTRGVETIKVVGNSIRE